MSIASRVRSSVENLSTRHSEMACTVVVRGASASAVLDASRGQSSLQAAGEFGNVTGRVFVSVASVAEPDAGETVTVDGERVTVVDVKKDAAGAMYVISYMEQKPVDASRGLL